MATIIPIQGYRPAEGLAERVCVPPFDTLSRKEACAFAKDNPDCFFHVTKPEIDLPSKTDIYSEKVYEKGAENLIDLIEREVLVCDETPSLYIYRLTMGDHIQTGLVCGASIDDYDNNIIKKHELTITEKEIDRSRHIDCQHANAGPVFLTYREDQDISAIIEDMSQYAPPATEFIDDSGIKHSLWVINNPVVTDRLVQLFQTIDPLYIADGHHRAFAASKVRKMHRETQPYSEIPWNHFLTVIFPDKDLMIYDYNRVIKSLNNLSSKDLLQEIGKVCEVSRDFHGKPEKPGEFGFHVAGTWYRLVPRSGTYPENDLIESLDVSILHNTVIAPIFDITDLKTDHRIEFVGGTRGLEELERRVATDAKCAFTLYPPSIDQLMSVSDAGKTMPPKSTWFYPKPYSGMVVYMFE